MSAFTRRPLAAKRCGGNEAWHLPLVIGPVAVAYNLEGVDDLALSIPIEVFTAIYRVEYAGTGRLGKASKWSMYAFRICASLMIAGIKNSFSPTLYPRIS